MSTALTYSCVALFFASVPLLLAVLRPASPQCQSAIAAPWRSVRLFDVSMRASLVLIVVTGFLCGCSTSAAKSHSRAQRPEPILGVQICFPDRAYESSPDVVVTEVEKTLWASGGISRVGETTTHQPVFRTDLFFETVRAAVIEVRDKDVNERYYVIAFPLTIELKKDEWTAWQLPSFRARNEPSMHLLHNRDHIYGEVLEQMDLDDSAPRLRYLLEDNKYGSGWITERRLNGEVHDIPPCA